MAQVFYAHASELATVSNTFTVDGTATDPTAVSFIITDPDGVATTYTYAAAQITKSATGVYTKDISCPTAGRWNAVIVGTGAASDVVPVSWEVYATSTSTLYCTVEQLKSRLGLSTAPGADDTELLQACGTASRQIDTWCDRHFYRVSATRTFVACDEYTLDVGDLVSVTTLKTDSGGDGTFETTWSASDYQLRPTDAAYRAEPAPYTQLRAIATNLFPLYPGVGRDDRAQVVGVFGWPAVPVAVQQAALILAADTFGLKDTRFGIQAYGDFAMRVRDNPRAMMLLAPYRRHPILVG